MSLFFEQVQTHARVQFLRHLRSPAIWWLAIAAPIGARYLIPPAESDYSVVAVNSARLAHDSAVIGFQLGIVMAIILTPLAYIFLRAGPTRKVPWQAEDVTPAYRSAMGLGQWLGDTAALWILMLALALAGVMLAFFRLPVAEINPFQIVGALCLIAAPALAVIAGLRTIFSMRPWLRKAGGDVLFFVLWMAMITVSAAFFAAGDNGSAYVDVLGLAAPISGATDQVIESFHIGGAPATEAFLEIDAMAGVLNPEFLTSRLFWVFVSAAFALLSGLLFKPRKIGWSKPIPIRGRAAFTQSRITATTTQAPALISKLVSEWRQILRPHWFAGLLLIVGLAGAILPFRGQVGPAIALLLIFPLTAHGARWRAKEMTRLTNLAPTSALEQLGLRLAAAVSLSTALCLPALGRMLSIGVTTELLDSLAIGVGLPVIAIAMGHVTRGPVAGRLILLILWYGYLNI